MGLSNPYVKEHMQSLFGPERAHTLTNRLGQMNSQQREATIVNELAVALKEYGHRFVLPFCFKDATGRRTSHHLILVTKHFKGYEVMKEIMARSSSEQHQGVPSFTYSPAISRQQGFLFELNRPLEDLRDLILGKYAGLTLTMREIYMDPSVGTPYLAKNYKTVLSQLEEDGIVKTRGRKSNRGFAD
jgi:hypothetical protein